VVISVIEEPGWVLAAALGRYAARFNLVIANWFEEKQTAAKKGRPVWNRMLKLLQQGKAERHCQNERKCKLLKGFTRILGI
jgi:hypothetical protein